MDRRQVGDTMWGEYLGVAKTSRLVTVFKIHCVSAQSKENRLGSSRIYIDLPRKPSPQQRLNTIPPLALNQGMVW